MVFVIAEHPGKNKIPFELVQCTIAIIPLPRVTGSLWGLATQD